LKEDLSKLQDNRFDDALISKILADEARFRRNLQDLRDEVEKQFRRAFGICNGSGRA
jgi:hypothetical protein